MIVMVFSCLFRGVKALLTVGFVFILLPLVAQQKFHNFIYAQPAFTHAVRFFNPETPGLVGKLGLHGGIGTIYDLGDGTYWSFSIAYAERGARKRRIVDNNTTNPNDDFGNIDFHWRLRYLSVPVLYGFPSYGLNMQLGTSVNYLVQDAQFTTDNFPPQQINFRPLEFVGHLNFEVEITPQVYFLGSFFHSINTIDNNPGLQGIGWWFERGSMHRGIAVGLSYYLSKPNFKFKKEPTTDLEIDY